MQNMLRSKPISTFSSSARSFFLGGTRCNAPDANSCTCNEDETCVSIRQQRKRDQDLLAQKPTSIVANTLAQKPTSIVANSLAQKPTSIVANTLAQKPSSIVANATSRVEGASVSKNQASGTSSHKVEGVDQSGSVQQVRSTSLPSSKSNSVAYAYVAEDSQNHVTQSSPLDGEQFYRAGIAAVNFISDLVNSKLPLSDGMGILSYSKNCMVEPASAIANIRSSNVKKIRKEDFISVHPRPPVSTEPGPSNNTSSYHGSKGRGDRSKIGKGFQHVASSGTGKSEVAPNIPFNNHDSRPLPQRTRTHSNRFVTKFDSNMQASNSQMLGSFKESFNRYPRDLKTSAATSSKSHYAKTSRRGVEVVKDILQQLKWGPATEEALYNLNFFIDAYQGNQVLKQLEDHSVALSFFYWLKRQPSFRHDGHTYTTMVGILGRAREFGAINNLLEQMVKDGCQPNVVTYNRLIHSYGRANYLKEALNVFNQMQEKRCEPDRVTYCTLIDIHAKAGYLDVAMSMYERMQQVGLSPDTFTYSVMINCLGKAGNLAAADRLFCEMVDQGCVPNIVTYNIMIALQAKARNYEAALKLYRDMQNAGFRPDKVTYSIVMEVLGHCGYLEEAEAVFVEMKQRNWVPDEPVYGLLVDLWGKAGNVEKAWEWYGAMLGAGLLPNVPTCNSLLSAFLRVHRLPDAYNLLQSMIALGLSPSLQTYTLLLSCCTDAQSQYDMGFCCELMKVSGHPAHVFLQSMPAAGPDGQNVRDHASKFLDLMHSEDREGKRGLVDAVVDFLHKSGLKEEAGSVWEVAAQRNVYPDAVKEKSRCYWLINLHVMSDGTAVTALSRTLAWFRKEMLVSGVSPNRIDIVTGWGRRSRVTGSSLVRQSVHELLRLFSFPFFTENGNSGCFVGCGEPLSQWLHHSYVERMHLL